MPITVGGTTITFNDGTTQSTASSSSYIGQRSQLFTSSGTFTVPTGVTAVKVTVIGGGGAGAGTGGSAGTGGTSSFGAFCSATGGGGAGNGGGVGSSGYANYTGSTGTNGLTTTSAAKSSWGGGFTPLDPIAVGTNSQQGYLGGVSGAGGWRTTFGTAAGAAPTGTAYGCGGGGFFIRSTCGNSQGSGGSGGGISIASVTGLTSGGSVTVTVGAGGTPGANGGAGLAGAVLVEW